jgi:CheY-like chemotaxis protein
MIPGIGNGGLILVVDDEPENVRILGDALKDEYSISVATTARTLSSPPCPIPNLI